MFGQIGYILALMSLLSSVQAIDKACPFKPADIVFCLDGSGSEGQLNFEKQLQFVSNFTNQFEIGYNNTRVSLITFGTREHNEFYLNQYYNKSELLTRIAHTKYPNGETNTHLALNFVRSNTLTDRHGAERNVTKLVIVLTDGQSLEPEQLRNAATLLKRNPLVTVMAIGIGGQVDPKELLVIASDSNHTFQVSSFDALHTIQTDLTDTACNACNVQSDVCFVLDSSGSEGNVNFHKQLEFVNMVISEFSFGQGHQTRVCLITFSTTGRYEIHLNQYHDKDSLMANVLKVPWRDGETMTNLGLDFARQELRNAHNPANKIVIVLTDGRSTEPDRTHSSAHYLHRDGAETFVVGIGHDVDSHELTMIASDKDHMFKVNHFDQLVNIHQYVADKICAKTKMTTTPIPTATTALLPTTTKAACGLKPADIVFVLDSSDSEGPENFQKEVEFATDFAAQFSIGTNNVQFSAVTFSTDVRNEFFFNKYHSRHDVLQALRNIQYMGKGTNTSGALNFVRTQSLLPANGARATSTKFVIVITDGRSGDPDQTKHEANLLHSLAEVISVGIGPGVDKTELANIASHHRVVTVDSFALLKSIKKQLTDLACHSGS